MRFIDTFKVATVGLKKHKSRSALTILGIVIGITSIIIVMALGQSAQDLILGQIQGLGPNNVFILPGKPVKSFAQGGSSIINDALKTKDYEDLQKKQNVPDAVKVTPFVFGPVVASFGSQTFETTIIGGNENIFAIYNLNAKSGQFFNDEDVKNRLEGILIGQKVVKELFGLSDPLGERIKIKDKTYKVIGVIETKGQTPFVNFDEVVVGPFTTVQQYILGIRYVQRIAVEAKSTEAIPGIIRDIETLLRNNHNISDPDKDDFNIQTQADLVKTIGSITDILTILLTSVAAISLIVGGIGIMNIMFVSVTERTREIGLRKALGATNKNILIQFLTEAVVLTMSGGLVGIIFGAGISFLATIIINKFFAMSFSFSFPASAAILGVLVSSGVGFVFGIFPAYQASKKSPIEALRYE